MALLNQTNNHVFICGQTRSGKTYFAGAALAQLPRPVLFINIQDVQLPRPFITVDEQDTSFAQLRDELRSGSKIDLRFPPALSEEKINNVTGLCLKNLMFCGFTEKSPVYVAIDEAQLLSGRGKEYAIQAATRGLSRGVRLIIITQRPALCDKTLYTQATDQVLFYLADGEKQYIQNKGLDFDRLKRIWAKGKYHYCYYDGFDYKECDPV